MYPPLRHSAGDIFVRYFSINSVSPKLTLFIGNFVDNFSFFLLKDFFAVSEIMTIFVNYMQ